ncbi:MAG: hypothetical protein K0R92_513 [Lachnospiraceae bacterium]|nr:hypothetical protein [Lachnospiraceae bacterium]
MLYGSTTAGSPTYATQSGFYYRIGKMVFINVSIKISAKGGMAGGVLIGNLPFTATGTRTSMHIGIANYVNFGAYKEITATVGAGTNYIIFYLISDNSGVALLNVGSISDAFEVHLSGFYFVP